MSEAEKEANSIYHERQSLELCALHALNNLFQGVAFTKESLDAACRRLSPDSNRFMNPHKSWIGLGNYDVNVLITALQEKDCTAVWWDSRKDPALLNLDNVIGFILNIPSEPKIGPVPIPFIRRKHWIAVKEIGGAFYNLDSKLKSPEFIGGREEVLKFLTDAVSEKEKELFVILSKETEESGGYWS